MHCKHCGRELAEGSAFCHHCGHPQNETAGQPAAGTPNTPAPRPAEEGGIKCPHCGSTRLQFTTTVKTQGVSVGDACCGYICLGPLGLLCGLCGAGSTETKEGWVCCDCGTRFTTQEAQRAVQQKLQREQDIDKKQQEREAQLATWRAMMDSCPYPPDQLERLYTDAVKQEVEKEKIFSAQQEKERKEIGAWQAVTYGTTVGVITLLIGALWFLFGLFTGGSWGPGLFVGVIGLAVVGWFSQRDDELFNQYASETLQALKQEKKQAVSHKEELKKYREAYQGLQNETASGSRP